MYCIVAKNYIQTLPTVQILPYFFQNVYANNMNMLFPSLFLYSSVDATVACKMLGYTTGIFHLYISTFR